MPATGSIRAQTHELDYTLQADHTNSFKSQLTPMSVTRMKAEEPLNARTQHSKLYPRNLRHNAR